jgi:hypothetical protein
VTIEQHQPPTAAELEQWRQLCDAATPGPWTYPEPEDADSAEPYLREGYLKGPSILPLYDTVAYEPRDCRFIAESRQAMPRLITEVETMQRDWLSPAETTALRAEVDRLRQQLADAIAQAETEAADAAWNGE